MLVIRDPAAGSAELEYVARALGAGELVMVPTDTVYGIAALATDEAAVARLYACKGRPSTQPTAAVFSSVGQLASHVSSLDRRSAFAIQALLPGPWTLVLANPAGVMPWLTGGSPGPLGVRVPAGALELPPIAATSANRAGEPTVERVQQLHPEIAGQLSCAVDRGPLDPAHESTVLDLVAWAGGQGEVRVLRDTAGRAGQALAALDDAPDAG